MEYSKFLEQLTLFVSEYSFKILAAITIFLVGKWLVKKITLFSKKLMMRAKVDTTLVEFLGNILYFMLLIAVIVASLHALDINTTSFIALIGAASLAVGLALKDSLSNIGAAVIIIVFRPFKLGDFVEMVGSAGVVKEINLFSTIVEPIDRSIVIIPNSSILRGTIINFSSRKERRVEHILSVGYEDSLKDVKNILAKIIADEPRILQEPAPLVAVNALSASSVDFLFRAWTKADDYWDVHYEVLERVKLEFDKSGITIPYPQVEVHSK